MHCELAVPGLFSAEEANGRFAALELLLARGRQHPGGADGLEAWLQESFDLGDGAFPAGALTLLAGGHDAGEANWARADPMHLRVMRDHVVAAPAEALELSREEAEALCGALNAHFPGLDFTAVEPYSWSARLEPAMMASAAFLNEAQMLLHAQPLNEAREARGAPAVNSLRLWGAGAAPREAECPWQSVAADDPAVRGAARIGGARHRALPRTAGEWLERLPEDGRHFALLDARRAPLGELERDWFAPLLDALRAGRVGMVTLHVPDADGFARETTRGDLRRFWRRVRPLGTYA
jgi:hypothetical protein